ncbi:MAG TPA: APC family permease [Thermoplasmata archaeon]|nr:APC family permease [Thermoplasmata archaeon]
MPAALGTETPGSVVNLPKEVTVRQDVYVRQASGLVRTVSARTALFANLVGMGIIVNFFWITEASAFYPNANLITTVGIGVLINVAVGYVYWMLASAMPRSGGDYIFVGRIFHPSVGLGVNLLFSVVFVTWAGLFAYFTAYYAIPTMLAAYTLAGGGGGALSAATTLISSTTDIFAVALVVLLAVILISFLPTKWIFRVSVGIFVGCAVIFVIMIGILLATPQSTFASDFNSNPVYGTSYAALVNAVPITTAGTFYGIVYTMLSFIGYANSSYYGGEIRGSPTRTQGLAIFGAPLIFAALIAGLYAASYYTFGRGFLIGISSAYFTTPGTAWPGPLYLVAYIVHVPILAAFLSLGLVLTFFGFSLIYFILPTRNLFAWSFDRVFPSFLTRVTRNGVPWVAVLVLGVSAGIALWIQTYTTYFDYATLGYSNFGFWFAVGIVCLAGAIFPFLKRSLFQQAPRIVRAKVGPVPVLTLVGVAAFGASWFVSYASSTATYLGITSGYSIGDLLFLPIVFVLGIIIYWISYGIQKSRGVPIDLISKELPPD